MLSLMLALLADPTPSLTVEAAPSEFSELEARAAEIARQGTPECGNPRLQRAEAGQAQRRSAPVTTDLMHRSDDAVRSYLLLDRRVNGCAAPISFEVRPVEGTLRRR